MGNSVATGDRGGKKTGEEWMGGREKGERRGEKEPPTMKPPPPLCSQNPNILVHERLVLVLGGFQGGRGDIETGFLSVAQASLWHEVLLQALSSPFSIPPPL